MPRTSRWFLAAALAAALLPTAARAQCDPSVEECPPMAPGVGISPGSSQHLTPSLQVTVTFHDFDGLSGATRQILVNGVDRTSSFSYSLNALGTIGTAVGTVTLTEGTPTVVSATVTDRDGLESGPDVATYTYVSSVRAAPTVSKAPFHEGIYDASVGSASLSWSTPAYRSLDTDRSVSVVYLSGQAMPYGFVQVDVSDASTGDRADALSLQVWDVDAAAFVTLQNGQKEIFFDNQWATARLAGQWDMRAKGTGDYRYQVVVRAWWNDAGGAVFRETREPVRIMSINEIKSPFGLGWSMPGVERIHPGRYAHATRAGEQEGVMLTTGGGQALFFTLESCDATVCTYEAPDGEFSTLTRSRANGVYTRRWKDGTTIAYSSGGLINVVTDPFGNVSYVDWGYRNNTWIPTGFIDPTGRLILVLFYDAGCGSCLVAGFRDPSGRETRVEYAAQIPQGARPTRVVMPDGSSPWKALTYSGNYLLSHEDARNGLWSFGYYRTFNTVVTGPSTYPSLRPRVAYRPVQVAVLKMDTATSLTRLAAAPRPSDATGMVTDPANHRTTYTVDRFWNVTSSTSHLGTLSTAAFDDEGRVISRTSGGRTEGFTYADGHRVATHHVDGALVLTATYDALGHPTLTEASGLKTHYEYGPRGELVRSWPGTAEDRAARSTVRTYDARGRLTSVTLPDGRVSTAVYAPGGLQNTATVTETRRVGEVVMPVETAFTYDTVGRAVAVASAMGTHRTAYDALNRVTRRVGPAGDTTRMAYTGPDLLSITDAAGKAYAWERDVLGRVTAEVFPDGLRRTFTYHADGLVKRRTDRRGQYVESTYDADHRLTTVATSDGATTTYAYQAEPRMVVAANGVSTDTIRGVLDGGESLSRERRVAVMGGRRYVLESVVPAWDQTYTSLQATAFAGATQLWTMQGGVRVDADPADPNQVARLTVTGFAGASASATVTFGKAGRPTFVQFPGTVWSSYSYDHDDRPWGVSYSHLGPDRALGGAYEYDHVGRVAQFESQLRDTVRTFGYDGAGRLTQADVFRQTFVTPPGCNPSYEECPPPMEVHTLVRSTAFGYDAVGNRTDRGAVVAAGGNRYTTFDGWSLAYDAEGNLTRKWKAGVADRTFTWNALGQLTSVTQAGGSPVSYGYNGLGERVRRHDAATGAVLYSLYHEGNLLMETDALGNVQRSYTHAGIDRPLTVTMGHPSAGAATYYYANEAPGHVAGLINPSGALVDRYVYTPFGEAAAGTTGTVAQPLRFMGREWDDATGMYYVRARWYDPHLGRFASEDPIGLRGGINTYAYAGNDPVNLRDPSGLQPCPEGAVENQINCFDSAYRLPTLWLTLNRLEAPNCIFVCINDDGSGPSPIDRFVMEAYGPSYLENRDARRARIEAQWQAINRAGQARMNRFLRDYAQCYAEGAGIALGVPLAGLGPLKTAETVTGYVGVMQGMKASEAGKLAGEIFDPYKTTTIRSGFFIGASFGAGWTAACVGIAVDGISP